MTIRLVGNKGKSSLKEVELCLDNSVDDRDFLKTLLLTIVTQIVFFSFNLYLGIEFLMVVFNFIIMWLDYTFKSLSKWISLSTFFNFN